MTEEGAVLVDTNVLLDVIEEDEKWVHWSVEQMVKFTNRMLINPMIFTELCYHAKSTEEVEKTVQMLGLKYQEFNNQSLFLTSQAYRSYRLRGGQKTSPLLDFFIGAHARSLGIPLLTRDSARYKTYFPSLPLISPESHPLS